ncbi:MAG: TonB-dependent hemoglobin/transferrin/lactoferrin family receptor [Pseudomonadota bacterium]
MSALSTGANAQDSELSVDEIVVYSGSRDARGLFETPNAVSVLDQAEIERRQPSTYEELIGDVPGVLIEGGPRGIAQEPNIRGFQDEQVVLRIDGARQNFNLAHRGRFFTDPEILKRVEVLRGGASTLFGSGALGGVILLETKDAADIVDPGDLWGVRLKTGFNSQGREFLGAATAGVQYGDFDALAFLSYRPMGEDLTDGNGDDILNSEIDSANALFKLGYEPGDHRFELSYQIYDDEGFTPPNADGVSSAAVVVNRELSFQTLQGEWTCSPTNSALIDLSIVGFFNEADVTEDRVRDGRFDTTNFTTIGGEIVNRSDIDVGLPVRLSYGIEAYQDEQEATRDGAGREQAPDARARYFAAFLQGDIELGSGFTFTPGVRFDYFEVEPEGDFPDLQESELSPKFALQWRPLDELQVFVTASQSFRAPTLTELYNDGVHFTVPGFPLGFGFGAPVFTGVNEFVPTPDLEPERSRAIEIGGRYGERDVVWKGDRIDFSANAYYARVDNFIDTQVEFINFDTAQFNPATFTLDVGGTTTNVNVDAELWGFEAEMAYDAEDWFFGTGLTIPRGRNRAGGALGSIPQDRWTLTGGIRPIPDVELGIRATFLDGQDDAPAGGIVTGGASVFDIFATYAPSSGPLEGAHFAVGIDNITDRTYSLHPNELNQPGIGFKAAAAIEF